jgi:hypothetical protein
MSILFFISNLILGAFFMSFDQPSQLDHIEATFTKFNFKLCLGKELDQEVLILIH